MDKYDILAQIGDGTFGSVARAVIKKTGQLVAIKRMKQKFYTWEECVKLPEVDVVRRIHGHPNVVKLREVIRENNELFFVFEYMDGDLLGVIKKAKQLGAGQSGGRASTSPLISYTKVKDYMRQMLQSLAYIHKRGYFHRDMKPENLLIRKEPNGEELLKLADFGLVKETRARPPYTDYVSTRWYRAPELLLQDRYYGPAVDIWAAGCIMCELITTRPLFPGTNEVDQLFKIMSVLGAPTEEVWAGGLRLAKKIRYTFPAVSGSGLAQVLPPHVPSAALELLLQMLAYDPKVRPTAEQCLQHPFFGVGVDESTAPSAAALDQLASAAKRLLPVAQTAPPALKSSVTDQAAALKAARTANDMSLSDASTRKFYLLGSLQDPAQSTSKLAVPLSTSPPSSEAVLSAPLAGRTPGAGQPGGVPPLANGHRPSAAAAAAAGATRRRSNEAAGASLAKKLAGLKNVQNGKGKAPNAYALPTAGGLLSPTTGPGLGGAVSKTKSTALAPLNNARDGKAPQQRRSPPSDAEVRSPQGKGAVVKREVDLDELMEEFATEMSAVGVRAQRHEAGAAGEASSTSNASRTGLANDPVAALLNNARYKRTSITALETSLKSCNSPRTTLPLAGRKGDEVAGKVDQPRNDHTTSKVASPSLKALLAKHKTGGLTSP